MSLIGHVRRRNVRQSEGMAFKRGPNLLCSISLNQQRMERVEFFKCLRISYSFSNVLKLLPISCTFFLKSSCSPYIVVLNFSVRLGTGLNAIIKDPVTV